MERFFKLKENGTTVGREVIAGLTTFFAMALHHRRQPQPAERVRHGMGRRFPGNHHLGHHRHTDHGSCGERAVRAGARHGPERLLRLHRVLYAGLHLAAGTLYGVHLRPDQHSDHGDEDPQVHHQVHSPQPAERHRRRHRHLCRLSWPAERRHHLLWFRCAGSGNAESGLPRAVHHRPGSHHHPAGVQGAGAPS